MTGLYKTRVFTEINFKKDFTFKYIDRSFLKIMKDRLVNVNDSLKDTIKAYFH